MVNQNQSPLPLEKHHSKIPLKRSLGSIPTQTVENENPQSTSTLPFVLTNKILGKGTNSEVYLGYDNVSLQKLAVKTVNLKKISSNSLAKLQKEIEILHKLKLTSTSERFVKIHKVSYKTIDKNEHLHLAMEYIPGCDLFLLCNEFPLGIPETLTKKIFYNIVLAIVELHGYHICHLDLKLENIMYNKENGKVKIIDFGFSQFTASSDSNAQILQTTFCGSIHYAAPELLSRVPFDGKKADVWSLGVVLFAMLAGHFPFDDFEGNAARIFQKIRNDDVEFPLHFSSQHTHLLSLMLEKDPSKRCSIEEVVSHPYFASMRSN